LKSQQQLQRSGAEFEEKTGIKFIAVDYRSGGGTQDQSRVSKEQQLYRQDYCGCMFGLSMQRQAQEKLLDELFSPIDQTLLPASIEERMALYQKRMELEEKNQSYKITKHKFLNYRQFFLKIYDKKRHYKGYALYYSTLPRKKAQGRFEYTIGKLHHFNRDEIKAITLETYNSFMQTSFTSLQELYFAPKELQKEMQLRQHLLNEVYDLTPIIIFDEIPQGKLTIELDSTTYEDTKEKLIQL